MDPKNQKKLKFNFWNMVSGLSLLTILNLTQPVDPLQITGTPFYVLTAVITAFLFPWLTVEVKDDKAN